MEQLSVLPIRSRVTSVLRKAILSGDYGAGQELSLTQLAEELGVSRTPIREAFQALEREGLLTLRMNKGAIVNTIDEKFIRDHFEVRALLECKAVSLAIRRCSDYTDLCALQSQAETCEFLSPDDYCLYNQQFHIAIWKKADNTKLFSLLSSAWNGPPSDQSDTQRRCEWIAIREHREILTGICNGDESSACAAMQAHLNQSMYNILNKRKKTT